MRRGGMANPEKSNHPIGILIVDDHAVVRAALRLLLERKEGLCVVGEASNRAEALEIASREQPEVILLDLCLREESGTDLIPDLLKVAEEARILVLTGVQDEVEHRRAIRLGAMGVVNKESSPDRVLRAIERVHAGELWLDRMATALLVSELRRPSDPPKPPAESEMIARLTCREREIISLLGEGKKNKQIAESLFISDATVRHHLTSILSKLGVSDRVELLIFAYKNSLVRIQS
jgi:two-component system, NarL family, nitrate/nitrite response regulator NarL